MAATSADIWEVVGGAANGGIIVRTGKDKSSTEAAERLSKGAKIRVVDRVGFRVGYELISGEGPQRGWVISKLQGKELLVKIEDPSDDILSQRNAKEDSSEARRMSLRKH
jgi:hypothetical protein